MLHVCVKPVIIYPVMCNYAFFILHVILLNMYILLNHQACIDNTVHALYNVCFCRPSHQFFNITMIFREITIIMCYIHVLIVIVFLLMTIINKCKRSIMNSDDYPHNINCIICNDTQKQKISLSKPHLMSLQIFANNSKNNIEHK